MGEEVIEKLSPGHTHHYSDDWKTDSSSHWHECSCGSRADSASHTKDSGTVTKKPTETETGIRTYHCSVCGYKMGEEVIEKLSPGHTHHYSADWKTDSSSHWHECSCGSRTDSAFHTKDSGTVTKKPTETETGIRTYHCSVCGYEMGTEEIAKLPPQSTDEDDSDEKGNGSNGQDNQNTPIKPGTDITKPGNGTNKDNTPQSGKEPFIKDAAGKIGWDVIRTEEETAGDGKVINVDMNGSAVVPGDIFDRIRGRDITITFDMDNGIIWSVDGKSITTDKAGDIDFSVKTGTGAIPADIINNVAGESFHIQLSLAHEGEFGFTAVLSINLGKENAGLTANLYYYNESTGELEFICADEVAEDGTVSLAFTHASDYVIAIDREESAAAEPTQPENPDGDSDIAAEETTETTQADIADTEVKDDLWDRIWVIVVCGVLVIAGLGIFLAGRKKNSKG